MAERADRGMAHRLGDHARELGPTPPLTGVQAELHPLELARARRPRRRASRQRGCRTRRRGGREKVRRARSPRRSPPPGDAARPSRGPEPRARSACGRRSRGTRSPGPRRERHLVDARAAVGPRRVAVEIAADARAVDEVRGRLRAAARAARAGRTEGRAARRGRPRRRASGSGSSDSTYSAEPVARKSSVPNVRLGDDERHRHALQRDADRTPLAALEHRHDRREQREPGEDARPDRPRQRRPRARVRARSSAARTGNLPAERRCDRLPRAAGSG